MCGPASTLRICRDFRCDSRSGHRSCDGRERSSATGQWWMLAVRRVHDPEKSISLITQRFTWNGGDTTIHVEWGRRKQGGDLASLLEHLSLVLILWVYLATHRQTHFDFTLITFARRSDVYHRLGPDEAAYLSMSAHRPGSYTETAR